MHKYFGLSDGRFLDPWNLKQSLELISQKLKGILTESSSLESLACSIKTVATVIRLQLLWRYLSDGLRSSLLGICGLEKMERRSSGSGGMLQFAVVLVMLPCHVQADRMLET